MLKKYIEKLKNQNEIYIRVKVNPSSPKTEARDIIEDETIKIDIAAPPIKGGANRELIKFLAKEFAVKANNVKIINGKASRIKLIKIMKSVF